MIMTILHAKRASTENVNVMKTTFYSAHRQTVHPCFLCFEGAILTISITFIC